MVVLLDSATYINLMRKLKDPRQVLVPYMLAGELYNCGVVRAEVLRGIKQAEVLAGMEEFFNIVPEVPTDPRLWQDISKIGWILGRKGKWPPVTDLAIAACAMRVGATLISPDRHFEGIEGLTVLKELP
jgi:predicted nucleic acid-binding protein